MILFAYCLADMAQQERLPHGDPRRQNEIPFGTEFNFGGVIERIVTRDDFSLEKARQVLKDETIAIIGYGVQGPGQALNLKENGFNVIVGQRQGKSFDKAVQDKWIPDGPRQNLFSIEEAVKRANQVQFLLSDAGQKELWPVIKPLLKPNGTLYFSHGFSITYKEQTGIIPPADVDVILVAPKGSGRSVRENFLKGSGINSSFAVFQDPSGRALERALATGMAIGSGFLFPTTFESEVFTDLTGERGVLMGAFYGLMQAGYNNLRRQGVSPQDAILHTVEITTQTISKIIGEKGADGMIRELPEELTEWFSSGFILANNAAIPVFEDLYEKVANGTETARVLEANSRPDYREILDSELKQIDQSELGIAGRQIREKRASGSTVPSLIQNKEDAIIAGALVGIFHAQYELLRRKGHMPSEAFNETVEEATQSLYPLIDRQGIDWMYSNCSTTAQRGALDWNGIFRDAILPRLYFLYDGRLVESSSGVRGYILDSDMWKVGRQVRALRPENQKIA